MARGTLLRSLINIVLDHRSPFLCIQTGLKLVPWLHTVPRQGRRAPEGQGTLLRCTAYYADRGRRNPAILGKVGYVGRRHL